MMTIMDAIAKTKADELKAAEAKERAEKAAKRAAWKKVALIMRDPRLWIKARQNDKEHVSIMVSADTMRLFQHELTVLETVSLHAGEIAVYKNTASDHIITIYDPKMPETTANQTFLDFVEVACERAEITLEQLDKEIELSQHLGIIL